MKPAAEIADLRKWLEGQFNEIREQHNDVTKRLDDLNGKLEDVDGQLLEIQVKNDELSRENEQLREEMGDLQENIIRMDANARRQNLLFYGLEENHKIPEDHLKELLQEIGVDTSTMQFQAVHRIGRPRDDRQNGSQTTSSDRKPPPRPIIARFLLMSDVQKVLFSRPKGAQPKVGVEEDVPPTWAAIRKKAYISHVKPAKAKGQKIRWVGPNLYIDGKNVNLETVAEQEQDPPSGSSTQQRGQPPNGLPRREGLRGRKNQPR